VGVFGEVVNQGQDHRLAAYLREALDEVHGDVDPYRARQLEGCSNPVGWRCSDLCATLDILLDELGDVDVVERSV
jgi:hypothetical protein